MRSACWGCSPVQLEIALLQDLEDMLVSIVFLEIADNQIELVLRRHLVERTGRKTLPKKDYDSKEKIQTRTESSPGDSSWSTVTQILNPTASPIRSCKVHIL